MKEPPSEVEPSAGGLTFALEVIAALGDFWTSAPLRFGLRLRGVSELAAPRDRAAVDGEINHWRTRKDGGVGDSNGPSKGRSCFEEAQPR